MEAEFEQGIREGIWIVKYILIPLFILGCIGAVIDAFKGDDGKK